ncbi:carbon-nitrogen hydrolase [Abortiporus biennis]|nr:carbon-nitrogen hydrolase [Abortiporus biennis]
MRIAVVQMNPKIGQVQHNIKRAIDLCSGVKPGSVDLVCFSEMAFTGYVFPDADSIEPYLEDPPLTFGREQPSSINSPTSHFCYKLALRLGCHVLAGYPEKLALPEYEEISREVILDETRAIDAESKKMTVREVGANSAVLFGPDGTCLGNYRKTNLFETDMTWAKPGTGFKSFQLPAPLNKVSLGICMDLNVQPPAVWTIEDGPYEIANHVIEQKSNVLVLLNAWLQSPIEELVQERDWGTLRYWAARLRPLWDYEELSDDEVEEYGQKPETIVVMCNRTGEENGKIFAGTSAAFSMRRGAGKARLLHAMEREAEGIEIWRV